MKVVFPDGINLARQVDELKPLYQLGEFEAYDSLPANDEEFVRRCRGTDGILLGWWVVTPEIMDALPTVKAISLLGTGAEKYVDLREAAQRGIAVTNTPGYGAEAVAEHTLALMLAVARHVAAGDREIRSGKWDYAHEGKELAGKTLGIVGLGGIGSLMAQIGNFFGMRVLCYTKHPSPERAAEAGVTFVDLPTIFRQSDFVSLHQLSTPETRRMITRDLLSLMRPDAIFVNTARSEIVDMDALRDLLMAGKIYGAGLDVFDEEPITDFSGPLYQLDNVVLTPHLGYNTAEANRKMTDIAVDNLVRYFAGNPINVVNAPVASRE